MSTEPILYRWWDADGRLLYVGKSVSLFARISSHRRTSPFFPEAQTMTIERFPDADALSDAEVRAIRTERPLFNKAHSVVQGGENARRLIVMDKLPEEPDTTVAHWEIVSPDDVGWGDIIRFRLREGDVVVQGVVDDDFLEGEFDDEMSDGWYLITDAGATETLSRSEAGLGDLHRWVCALPDDPFRQGILDGFYSQFLVDSEVA